MEFNLDSGRSILARTPNTLNAWLRDLPEYWVLENEGPGTWSPFDIVGHLIHGERTDWLARARIILEQGAATTFEPFDRFAQLEFDPDETINERLDQFAALRLENLAALDELHLTPDHFKLEGRHPEFGIVTLGQLLATWVVHDLSHVAQVARVMSKQYSSEVGPWAAYLPLLGD